MHIRISKEVVKRVMLSNRIRSNDHKVKHKKFHLNIRKSFFTLRVAGHWNRLLMCVMESLSLEICQTHLAMFLCHLPWLGSWIN